METVQAGVLQEGQDPQDHGLQQEDVLQVLGGQDQEDLFNQVVSFLNICILFASSLWSLNVSFWITIWIMVRTDVIRPAVCVCSDPTAGKVKKKLVF